MDNAQRAAGSPRFVGGRHIDDQCWPTRAGAILLTVAMGLVAALAPGLARADYFPACTAQSLFEAVRDANNDPGGGIVHLGAGCTYSFTTSTDGYNAFIPIVRTITLVGDGAGATIERLGPNEFRFFSVRAGASLTLQNLTLSNAAAPGGPNGGDASATHESTSGSPGQNGGSIENFGTVVLEKVLIAGGHAGKGGDGGAGDGAIFIGRAASNGGPGGQGGAIWNDGTLVVRGNSTLRFNHAGDGGTGGVVTTTGQSARGGAGGAGGGGGAIFSSANGTLLIQRATLFSNQGGKGGNAGNGNDTRSSGAGGHAGFGGAVRSLGSATVEDSTIELNSALGGGQSILNVQGTDQPGGNGGWGGGLSAESGSLTIRRTTINRNNGGSPGAGGSGGQADGFVDGSPGSGGGLFINVAATVENTTLAENVASNTVCGNGGYGGAVRLNAGGDVVFKNVTIANNFPGDVVVGNCSNQREGLVGGIWNEGGKVHLRNTILQSSVWHPFGRTVAPNLCGGSGTFFEESGFHSIQWGTVSFDGGTSNCDGHIPVRNPKLIDIPPSPPNAGRDPALGPVTMALGPGSLALNAGDAATCTLVDERGITRPQGAGCEVGAQETRMAVVSQPQDVAANEGTTASFTAIVDSDGMGPPTTQWQQANDFGGWTNVVAADGSSTLVAGSGTTYVATFVTHNLTAADRNKMVRVLFTNSQYPAANAVTSNLARLALSFKPVFIQDLAADTDGNVDEQIVLSVKFVGVPGVGSFDWQVSKDNGATWNNYYALPGGDGGTGQTRYLSELGTLTMHNATVANSPWRVRARLGGYAGGAPVYSKATRLLVRNDPVPARIVSQQMNFPMHEGEYNIFVVQVTGNPRPTGIFQVSADNGASWTTIPEAGTVSQDGYTYSSTPDPNNALALGFVPWAYRDGLNYRVVLNGTLIGPASTLRVSLESATTVECPAQVASADQYQCTARVQFTPQQGPVSRIPAGRIDWYTGDISFESPPIATCTLDPQGACANAFTAGTGIVHITAKFTGALDANRQDRASSGSADVETASCFAPSFDVCPASIAVNASSTSCQATVPDLTSQVHATARGCAPFVNQNPSVGNSRPIGTSPIVFQALLPTASSTCSSQLVVNDTSAPIAPMSLAGDEPMDWECGVAFEDPGAFTQQTCGGPAHRVLANPSLPLRQLGDFTLTYTGNYGSFGSETLTRQVRVSDHLPPYGELIGPALMNVETGATFVDPGAVAHDECEGDLPATATSTVNTNTPGRQRIFYSATDHSGNVNNLATFRDVDVGDHVGPRLADVSGVNDAAVFSLLGGGTNVVPRQVLVTFNEAMSQSLLYQGGIQLIDAGSDGVFQTPASSLTCDAPSGDDVLIDTTQSIQLSATQVRLVPQGRPTGLQQGWYRLRVCANAAYDTQGNGFDGNGAAPGAPNFELDFRVETTPPEVLELLHDADQALPSNEFRYVQDEVTTLKLRINKKLANPPGDTTPGDVTNPHSYRLLDIAATGYGIDDCSAPVPAGQSDVSIDSVSYEESAQNPTSVIVLGINGANPLADSNYHLMLCQPSGVHDLYGNAMPSPSSFDFHIDRTPPPAPAIGSSTYSPNVWTASHSGTLAWPSVSDGSGSGVAGYGYSQNDDPLSELLGGLNLPYNPSTTQVPVFYPDGIHYFHAISCDNAGNCSPTTHFGPILIDSVAPSTPALSSPDHSVGAQWSGDRHLSVAWTEPSDSGSGIAGYAYVFDTSPGTIPGATLNQAAAAPRTASADLVGEGSYYFHLRTCDIAGNCDAGVHLGPFKIDATAPINALLTSPDHVVATWSANQHLSVQWSGASDSGSGVAGYSFVFDTSSTTVPDTTLDSSEAAAHSASSDRGDGANHYFHLRSCDAVSNCSAAAHFGPFLIDSVLPTNAVVTSNHTAATWSADPHLTMQWSGAADATSGVAGYSTVFDTSAATVPDTTIDQTEAGAHSVSSDRPDGAAHYFHLRTCDVAGNCSASVHLGPYRIDTQPPTGLAVGSLTYTASQWSMQTTAHFLLSGAVDTGSGVGGYAVVFDASPGTVPAATIAVASSGAAQDLAQAASDGDHQWLHVRACDAVGNCAAPVHSGPYRVDHTAPTAPTSFTSTSHTSNQPSNRNVIALAWSGASDATSGIAAYHWHVDNSLAGSCDGDSVDAATSQVSSDALAEGIWYAHLCVLDVAGNRSAMSTLGPFPIDTGAPTNAVATSSTHSVGAWSMEHHLSVQWSGASDSASAIAGYSFVFDSAADTVPDSTIELAENVAHTAASDRPDGIDHYFHLRSCDTAGNCSATQHLGPFKIDATAPIDAVAASSSHTPASWSAERHLVVHWSGASDGLSGIAGYSYVFDNLAGTVPDGTIDVADGGTLTASSDRADGADHYFHLRTCDVAGNCSAAVHLGPFQIDTGPPAGLAVGSVSHSVGAWSAQSDVHFTLSGAVDGGSGVAGYATLLDTTATTVPPATIDLADSGASQALVKTLADGDNQWLHVRACDGVGNCAATVHSGPYRIDHTAPTAPTLFASPSHTVGQTSGTAVIDLAWSGAGDATSGVSAYHWQVDHSANGSCDGHSTTLEQASSASLGEGVWYAHLCVLDVAGNRSETLSLGPITIDLTGPTLSAVAAVGRHEPGVLTDGQEFDLGITRLELSFSEPLGGASITPQGFQLIAAGADGLMQSTQCDAVSGDDAAVTPTSVLQNGTQDRVALSVGDLALPSGRYRLLVCARVQDRYGNAATPTRLDFGVSTTNLVTNPNFDADLHAWDTNPGTGIDVRYAAQDAGEAWASGSLDVSTTAATGGPWFASQCVSTGNTPALATADVTILDGGALGSDAWLGAVLYQGSHCNGVTRDILTSSSVADAGSGWQPLSLPIAGGTAGAYASLRLMLFVDPRGQANVHVRFDNTNVRASGDALFADGFELSAK